MIQEEYKDFILYERNRDVEWGYVYARYRWVGTNYRCTIDIVFTNKRFSKIGDKPFSLRLWKGSSFIPKTISFNTLEETINSFFKTVDHLQLKLLLNKEQQF